MIQLWENHWWETLLQQQQQRYWRQKMRQRKSRHTHTQFQRMKYLYYFIYHSIGKGKLTENLYLLRWLLTSMPQHSAHFPFVYVEVNVFRMHFYWHFVLVVISFHAADSTALHLSNNGATVFIILWYVTAHSTLASHRPCEWCAVELFMCDIKLFLILRRRSIWFCCSFGRLMSTTVWQCIDDGYNAKVDLKWGGKN